LSENKSQCLVGKRQTYEIQQNARRFNKQGKFDVLSEVLMKIQVFLGYDAMWQVQGTGGTAPFILKLCTGCYE
jgi:hypothetical protein